MEPSFHDVMSCARTVFEHLGMGHSESVYHRALCAELIHCGIPHRSEVVTPIMFKGQCVGTGRADIIVGTMVIELKANSRRPSHATPQLKKYIESMRNVERKRCIGAVINFNSSTGNIEGLLDVARIEAGREPDARMAMWEDNSKEDGRCGGKAEVRSRFWNKRKSNGEEMVPPAIKEARMQVEKAEQDVAEARRRLSKMSRRYYLDSDG